MTDTLAPYLDALKDIKTPPFSFRDLPGFPYSEYSDRLTTYTEAESWYSGEALDETVMRSGKEIDLYPVRINPLRGAVQKHAFSLFGEVGEDDRPLVSPKMVFHDDTQKKLAEDAEECMYQVWFESNGRAIQWQNGAIAQVYGGCVFEAVYDPFDPLLSYPVRIEAHHPKCFLGKPDSSDMFRLREAWIVKPISQEEAKDNGYTGGFSSDFEVPWLVKHWTKSTYEAWVNNQPVRRWADAPVNAWVPVSAPNTLGFVPVVYIPHIRVDGFYGENMFDHVKGILKELNLRVADYGDAVNTDAHAYMGMRNVNGAPDVMQIAPNLNVVNVGSSLGIGGNDAVPDLWDLRKERASESMSNLVEMLFDQYRRDVFIPRVADGEDEGSQRSGLTLAMRMLSLLWHTQTERVFWTTGLNLLTRMVLRTLADKAPESGISIRHATLRVKQDWSPVLPRDREMLVNEVVARMGAKLGSPETLFNILGDIQDSDDEIKRIVEFQKKITEATVVQQPFGMGQPGGSAGRKQVSPGSPTPASSEKSQQE